MLGCDFKILNDACGLRDGQTIFKKPLNVEPNCLANFPLGFFNGETSSNTTGQVRDIS